MAATAWMQRSLHTNRQRVGPVIDLTATEDHPGATAAASLGERASKCRQIYIGALYARHLQWS